MIKRLLAAVLLAVIPVAGYSQPSSYTNPGNNGSYVPQPSSDNYGQPQEGQQEQQGWSFGSFFGGRKARQRNAPLTVQNSNAAAQDTADPNDPRPTTKPGVTYEENIPVNEMPRANAARTVSAESAQPGSVSALNRQINFPRDQGDDVDVLKLQVFLDYYGYSPGEIDGRWGYNTERALFIYQKNNGMDPTGQMDDRILARVGAFRDGFLLEYAVTKKDVDGPYYTIPREYYAQAKLKYLPYESCCEELAEKFHCSQTLLRKLNAGVDFEHLQPGQKILGLNVMNGMDDKRGEVSVIRVSKHNKWIEAFDADGRFMFYYPSTLGSQYDPLPLGNFQVINVEFNPQFLYQPKLFWDANHNDPDAWIPPGPNCPVGDVWIGTSRKSVGIHGTPNPENISKNESHGCIRMCNWDARQLAKRVKEGTKIEFVE